ncbi:hypothetical protein ACMHYO_14090 [Allopusillimonas ginsengisoli]|uniref:hypothetical protein n=1 Tax=Allopusillimonas ginsengisoli TaxID=453575 RepID=UPI0039C023F9
MTGIQAMVHQMQAARPYIPPSGDVPGQVKEEMAALRASGKSLDHIAKQYNTTLDRVRTVFKYREKP